MNIASEEITKKTCAFILRLRDPLEALIRILEYFDERKIQIESIQQNMMDPKEAVLILHCLVERDRIKYTKNGLERIKGVIELELLESKNSNIVK